MQQFADLLPQAHDVSISLELHWKCLFKEKQVLTFDFLSILSDLIPYSLFSPKS